MRIRFEIEIPNWTRWIAAGLIVGIGLGYGMAVVRADPVSVKTWNSGDALTAAALSFGGCPRPSERSFPNSQARLSTSNESGH